MNLDVAKMFIETDAYEEAAEEGYVRYLSATRYDPGCYSDYLDFEYGEMHGDPEDYYIDVIARYGKTELFNRTYNFFGSHYSYEEN